MIEGKLVDLVPFEDDFARYMETWMNEEAWFRTWLMDRREPHSEKDVKAFIEKMEKKDNAALIGFQAKNGDPIGSVLYDHLWNRVRRAEVMFFAGDARYEGTDEQLDGLLMLVCYCFETHNLHRLDTFALAFDEVKIDQMRRAGFSHEGALRQHVRWGGAYIDVELFGLLQHDWPGYTQMVEALDLQPTPDIEPKPALEDDHHTDQPAGQAG